MVHNVRDKHHIAAGNEERNIDDAPHGLHLNVAVEGLGVFLVEVAEHRILLFRGEIFRLVQKAVQLRAVKGRPVVEFHRPPVVVGDLRIDGREFFRFLRRHPVEVHGVTEVALLAQQYLGVAGLEETAVAITAQAGVDGRNLSLLLQRQGGKAVLLGYIVK